MLLRYQSTEFNRNTYIKLV